MVAWYAAVIFCASAISPQSAYPVDVAKQDEPLPVRSVCDLVKRPRNFNGKRVQVESDLESDGMHGAWLTDSSCKTGVVLWTDERATENTDIKELEDAIFRGMERAGTATKTIHAVFEGKFLWRRATIPKYVLEMDAVQGVKVSAGKPK